MQIKKWISVQEQFSKIGKHQWSVARLITLSKDFEPFEAPINCLSLWSKYDLTMRELVMHCNAIQDADLNYPIILDEDGEIMDGRHRIMKAIMLGQKTIKAVRFDENPTPCRIED
jgi:hypothetical protein